MMNMRRVKTHALKSRKSKVEIQDFAKPPVPGKSFFRFYNSLPNILKARELHTIAGAIVKARRQKKAVIFMAGAHVIKCGLNPILIDLIKKKVINCLVLNGAGIIHDFEIAFQGKTSEDVGAGLSAGKFGMGRETADFLNAAVEDGVKRGLGLGDAVADKMANSKLRYQHLSVVYQAYKNKIPVCVFVAIGTDIIHQHPSFNAALTAEGSLRDFQALVENVSGLNNGGVLLNFGSAVILPEVFLKALNLARNLGHQVRNFISANFDMIYHYRPLQNVVSRPVQGGGEGFYIIGHHEIMLPLLAQAIIEKI